MLILHGAMVAQGYDDCEGDLINEVRKIVGPKVPIGVELDLHCHFTELMRSRADILIAYTEYPHTDEIGRTSCRERKCHYVSSSGVGGSSKKKQEHKTALMY